MNEALLGILTLLVGALIWMVKAVTTRSDRLIEQRDKEVSRLITSLEKAVKAFSGFELESHMMFEKLISRIDVTEQAQAEIHEKILEELRTMNQRLALKPGA